MPAEPVTSDRRIVFVHAHPDDETIDGGATMARYAAEGVHITLVTCTRGEKGEILVPELAHLTPDELGRHRARELEEAMKALGVSDHRFLGGPGRYRDSGMMGEPSNDRPGAFWRADVDEAAAHLAAVLREVRPQVLVTYDANGGYGHPDHIQTHRVAMRAVDLAAEPSYRPDLGPAWQINKIYWGVMPVSALQAALDALPAEGTPFVKVERAEDTGVTVPDDAVTTVLDVGLWEDARMAALRAHATQIRVFGPYVALAGNVGLTMPPAEYYQLARGRLGVPDGDVETDLFAGIHRSG